MTLFSAHPGFLFILRARSQVLQVLLRSGKKEIAVEERVSDSTFSTL